MSGEVSGLEGVEERVKELSEQANKLTMALANINVWGQNQEEIEQQLKVSVFCFEFVLKNI